MPLYEPEYTPSTGGNTLQTLFTQLTSDTSTTSTTLVNLISQNITTSSGSFVDVGFSVAASATTANEHLNFVLLIDGVTTSRGTNIRNGAANVSEAGVILYRATGLSATAHTFTIQWAIVTTGTAQIRAATSNIEHCSLFLEEKI